MEIFYLEIFQQRRKTRFERRKGYDKTRKKRKTQFREAV